MLANIWSFLQDETNRAVLTWIGGGVVVVVGGAWSFFKFSLSRRKGQDSNAHTAQIVTATHGGIAAGRDISGDIHLGLDEQEMARQFRPLEEQLTALSAQVAREKGVEFAPLRATLNKLGEKNVNFENVLTILDEKADKLIALRKTFADLRVRVPELAAFAQQIEEIVGSGNFDLALSNLFKMMEMQNNDFANAQTIATSMQTEDQKKQMERWKILQDTQTQIFSIQQDVTAHKAHPPDKAYRRWDQYIRGGEGSNLNE
jgi:hypothetical protein